MATLFVPEATAAYSGGKYHYEGRDAIVEFMRTNMDRPAFHTSHRMHHPEITIDGDEATGIWAMEDVNVDYRVGLLPDGRRVLRGPIREARRSLAVPAHRLQADVRDDHADEQGGDEPDGQLVVDQRPVEARRAVRSTQILYILTVRQISDRRAIR